MDRIIPQKTTRPQPGVIVKNITKKTNQPRISVTPKKIPEKRIEPVFADEFLRFFRFYARKKEVTVKNI
jgi:hypothetical protein